MCGCDLVMWCEWYRLICVCGCGCLKVMCKYVDYVEVCVGWVFLVVVVGVVVVCVMKLVM